MAFNSLEQQLLLAMPQLADAWFKESVILLLEHNEKGAMGFSINKPAPIGMEGVLAQLNLSSQDIDTNAHKVVMGGPVQPEAGFILHPPTEQVWETSQVINEHLWLTHSKDILAAIGVGRGPTHSLTVLGYAGWGSEQLEQELLQNAWLNVPCPEDILFHVPLEERWRYAANAAGINLDLLSTDIGHA
ncbi:MAG TPA: YqgE/AlgH family protein [Alcanivoracaceae bacterium]|nr:YqgE/AlgH family protein [Alcanivoracaceae bacterium]